MNGTTDTVRLTTGKQLTVARRNALISKMIDYMVEGYTSTNSLAKKLNCTRRTVDRYKPFADELISKQKFDRNAIRALQIRRTYQIIESLMDELKDLNEVITTVDDQGNEHSYKRSSVKERTAIYSQIFKFSSHLALITGLNVETQVHVDAKKLVIVRSATGKNVVNEGANVIDVPAQPAR